MTSTSDSITNNLPGLVLLILIIALPLAFLVSIGLLRLYRRTVIRTMGKRANVGRTESVPLDSSALPQEPVQTPLSIAVLDSVSGMTAKGGTDNLSTELLRAPWRAAAIYAIAGLCYAIVMTIVFLAATDNEILPLRFLVLFWYYAWPVVITVCLVAAATWRTRCVVISIYFLILAILGAIALAGNSVFNWRQIAVLWLFTNFLAAVLLVAFLNRRIRAVGPLVLTFMILAVTGSLLLPFIVGNDERLLHLIINFEVALWLGNYIFEGLIVLGFILFGAIGWLMLQWIGRLYKRKKISEQSIMIDAVWLLFGIFQSVGLIFEGEVWFVASLLAFVVYKIISWSGFSVLGYRVSSSRKSPNLLLLRVFSLGQRSERLFDVLGMHWRYVGSIRLIAGPDLATTTMEPHEFLDFLSGKLTRRFIDSTQTLDLRISEMDVQPDRDGQFRVNDFFCYDDVWKMVLSRLISTSDVVLMDLRSFSSQNAGCVFEINELINVVSLGRVMFIIDETTDESFLRQILQQSWDHMSSSSPNRLSTSGALQLFHLKRLSDRELQQLLHVLAIAAQPAPEAQVLA